MELQEQLGPEGFVAGEVLEGLPLQEQLAAKGRIQAARTPEAWLQRLVTQGGLVLRDITAEIAAVAAHLPPSFPSDPFDRLIAATAIVGRMPLVTSDARIQDSGVVRTIW